MRRYKDLFPVVPSFGGEVRLRLERGWFQTTNATRGLPCSPMNLTPTGSIHLPLYRQPSRWKPTPLQQVRGTHPQLNWRLPNASKLSRQIKDKLVRTKSKLGFPMKH